MAKGSRPVPVGVRKVSGDDDGSVDSEASDDGRSDASDSDAEHGQGSDKLDAPVQKVPLKASGHREDVLHGSLVHFMLLIARPPIWQS